MKTLLHLGPLPPPPKRYKSILKEVNELGDLMKARFPWAEADGINLGALGHETIPRTFEACCIIEDERLESHSGVEYIKECLPSKEWDSKIVKRF